MTDLKRTLVVLLHIGYWLVYLLLLLVIFAIAEVQVRKTSLNIWVFTPLLIICVLPNLISFYSCYFLLFSRFLSRGKILALINSGIIICLLSAFCGLSISLIFFGFRQVIFSDAREFISITITLFVIAAIHGGIALVIRGFVTWYEEIKLKEELAQRNFQMELALIKSQINPHFLFNTINNIDVLITRNAQLASEYLNKLSDILRYMVYETKTEKISLAKELSYLEKYLELQKIRTTNPDYVTLTVTGEVGNLTITPMILFPFIENAFKHTENSKKYNSIKILITINEGQFYFECENSYQKNMPQKQDVGGLGNELIKKRLMLTYPEKHLLKIIDNGSIYQVKLTLYED